MPTVMKSGSSTSCSPQGLPRECFWALQRRVSDLVMVPSLSALWNSRKGLSQPGVFMNRRRGFTQTVSSINKKMVQWTVLAFSRLAGSHGAATSTFLHHLPTAYYDTERFVSTEPSVVTGHKNCGNVLPALHRNWKNYLFTHCYTVT
jgi:hypothetical protein